MIVYCTLPKSHFKFNLTKVRNREKTSAIYSRCMQHYSSFIIPLLPRISLCLRFKIWLNTVFPSGSWSSSFVCHLYVLLHHFSSYMRSFSSPHQMSKPTQSSYLYFLWKLFFSFTNPVPHLFLILPFIVTLDIHLTSFSLHFIEWCCF